MSGQFQKANFGQQLAFFKFMTLKLKMDYSGGVSCKESTCQCRRCKLLAFDPWVGKIPWSRKWQPTPIFLPGKFHRQRRLVSYSPWGLMTEHKLRIVFTFLKACLKKR